MFEDYYILTNLFFDVHLDKIDRMERRANEGFGDDEFGSNEVEIMLEMRTTTTFGQKAEEDLTKVAKILNNQK